QSSAFSTKPSVGTHAAVGVARRSPKPSRSTSGKKTRSTPSSTDPSQSSSTPLQTSVAPGATLAIASSQSVPQRSPLQHAKSIAPSPSASRSPTVVGSQSSSIPSGSQTSVAPGRTSGSES